MPSHKLSPLAQFVPISKPGKGSRDVFGICVHTTGSGIVEEARKHNAKVLDYTVAYYMRPDSYWAHYVIGYDGSIIQITREDEITWHVGLEKADRAAYLDGSWKQMLPSPLVTMWKLAWLGKQSPVHLYPGRSPNTDYCLDPAMRVLTADLRWVPIGEIAVGMRLIGFHEDLRSHNTMTPSEVLSVERLICPRVRVITTHGEIICSNEHMFVGTPGRRNRSCWLRADELRCGSRLRYFGAPWETDDSHDGDWLAGMLDGEGHWSWKGELIISQNPGPVFDRILSVLAAKRVKFRVSVQSKDLVRQVTKKPLVLAVEQLPEGEVVAIKTTTRTFFAEGFFSHNCGIEMLPLVGETASDWNELCPVDPNLRYTCAQHDAVVRLCHDIAGRWKFPEWWWTTPRLLGHEDLNPLRRSTRKPAAGWDPGGLRDKPWFDWTYVKNKLYLSVGLSSSLSS